jgi:hypothetical protein
MEKVIREKRKLVLNRKRITPKIIRELSFVINDLVKQSKGSEDFLIVYSIDATDDSSYESDSIIIFEENGILDTKIIKKINMSFVSFKNSKKIEIQLLHSEKNEDSENYIWISGSDSTWVNGLLKKFEDILGLSEPQTNLTSRYLTLWFILLSALNVSAIRIVNHHENEISGLLALIVILGFPIASLYSLVVLQEYLYGTYPDIELQTGPSHFRVSLKRRKRINLILTLIILPVIITVLYDVFKSQII